MASRRSRPRRFLLPTLLAAVLAAEITGIALARSIAPGAALGPVPAQASAVVSDRAARGAASHTGTVPNRIVVDATRDPVASLASLQFRRGGVVATPRAVAPDSVAHVATVSAAPKTSPPSTRPASSGSGHVASPSYHGTNHVWIPTLGISKGIQSFPCSRNRPPDAGVYRWGCAGRNNVYLLSHAWSTFKPLHDAYVGGRLRKGMKVVYGDGTGHVHTYAVSFWKVVAPTSAASWAWASLSQPSMTLQTCVGSNSQYRLMVRLIQAG